MQTIDFRAFESMEQRMASLRPVGGPEQALTLDEGKTLAIRRVEVMEDVLSHVVWGRNLDCTGNTGGNQAANQNESREEAHAPTSRRRSYRLLSR
jgi:hypothetical protein